MRCPDPGHRRRFISIGSQLGRLATIAYGKRRVLVADTELYPRRIELPPRVEVELLAQLRTQCFPFGIVALVRWCCTSAAEAVSHRPSEAGICLSDRSAFGIVSVEYLVVSPSVAYPGQFPAQVASVFDRGVVTQTAGRRKKMRGVSCKEDTANAKAFGHQREAGGPFGHRDDLVINLLADGDP